MKNLEERAKGIVSLDNSFAEVRGSQEVNLNSTVMNNNPSTTANSTFMRTTGGGGSAKFEKKLYEKVIVGTYSLDLGNVIAGSSATFQFRVYNVGKIPQLIINFDQKHIRPHGFRLTQERLNIKNRDKNYDDVRIIFQTKKNSPTGRQTFLLPVEILNGPKYLIEIYTNVTVPEIQFSSYEVDFEKVICGQKKTITIRIENGKEVDCYWSIVPRKEQKKRGENKYDNKFLVSPSQGVLGSRSKQNIEVTFTPTYDKSYIYKFDVSMQDNQNKWEIECRGDGVNPHLLFIPEELNFEP